MEVKEAIYKVQRLENVVRGHINTHRYQTQLLKNSSNWNQICSSLDVIGDALYAIDSYLSASFPTDLGLKYIYCYGILQALFLQQDALKHLTEAFGLEYNKNEALLKV